MFSTVQVIENSLKFNHFNRFAVVSNIIVG